MAAVVEIPNLQGETQKGRFLCWAAAAVTAIRTLRANQPAANPPAATDKDFREQWDLSIYNVADGSFDAFGRDFDVSTLKSRDLPAAQARIDMLRNGPCKVDASGFGVCDRPGFPILLDHEFDVTPEGKPLTFCDLTLLMKANRPVVFEWRFLEPGMSPFGDPLGPGGDHFMVVVGTRDDRGFPEVRIWDPWPQEFGAPNKADHLRWIPYAEYARPISDHGSDRPRHGVDRYDIRPPGAPRTPGLGQPCNVSTEIPSVSPSRQPVEKLLQGYAAKSAATREGNTPAPNARYRPLPVFSLTQRALADAGAIAPRVVEPGAFASVEPVEDAAGNLVDANLVVNDGESSRRAGYMNLAIARRLYDALERHAADPEQVQPASRNDYFILAIPERREFFLAFRHPQDDSLQLVAIEDEEPLATKAGLARCATAVFPRIARDIAAQRERFKQLKQP